MSDLQPSTAEGPRKSTMQRLFGSSVKRNSSFVQRKKESDSESDQEGPNDMKEEDYVSLMTPISTDDSLASTSRVRIPKVDPMQTLKEERMKREITSLIAWANAFLKGRGYEAKNIATDFRDGVLLINLLEATFNQKVAVSYNLRPKMLVHRLDNYSLIFDFLRKNRVHLLSIDIHEVSGGNENQTLVLLWNILRKLTMRDLAALSNLDESLLNSEEDGSNMRRQESKTSSGIRNMLKTWISGK